MFPGKNGDGGDRTRAMVLPNDACIRWEGATNSKGYGTRMIRGRAWLAHRAAYVEAHGSIPPGFQLHHLCGNRLCVNPAHLEPVTAQEHNRAHLPHVGAAEIIEAILGRGEGSRRECVAAAVARGLSENSVDVALARMPVERVRRGVYRLSDRARFLP